MSAVGQAPLIVNGWALFAHPLFLSQIATLAREVNALRAKEPIGYKNRNPTKRLAAITKLALEVIPQDPTNPAFRQGDSLGDAHRHWFRAKFFQHHRLFFRFHATSKIIVFVWANDEDTKCAYESSNDAYRVFRKMLARGHPPNDWDSLLKEARAGTPTLTELAKKGGVVHERRDEGIPRRAKGTPAS